MSEWGRDRAASGFTSQVDLTRAGRISESRRVVMQVQVWDVNEGAGEDEAKEDAAALRLDGPLYLRGGVLTKWDSAGQWSPDPNVDHRRVLIGDQYTAILAHPRGRADTYELDVTLLEPSDILFAPMVPLMLAAPGGAQVDYEPLTQLLAIGPARPSIAIASSSSRFPIRAR